MTKLIVMVDGCDGVRVEAWGGVMVVSFVILGFIYRACCLLGLCEVSATFLSRGHGWHEEPSDKVRYDDDDTRRCESIEGDLRGASLSIGTVEVCGYVMALVKGEGAQQ